MRVKVREELVSQAVVVVVVTNKPQETNFLFVCLVLSGLLFFSSSSLFAEVLPEDRADLLYHGYDGGGVEVTGPSVLVRKKFNEKVSAKANYYVDNITSASIDVVTTASPYTEKRVENSVAIDFLNKNTLMSLAYTSSDESDFDATTVSLNLSQTMFGDLTTVGMGYSQGDNTISRNGDANFEEEAKTRNYRLSLSQVINKDFIMVFAFEAITDEGFLNNPYRSVRYLDATVPIGYSYQPEIYPNTRTSTALAVRGRYYLPYRAALHAGYRFFNDTWDITAHTFEFGYTIPYKKDWILDFSYRNYSQSNADFYSDLFQVADEFIFLARDKELSTFKSQTLGLGVSYEFSKNGAGFIKRGSLNMNIDLIMFDYDDFRDLRVTTTPGEEPLYSFDATVLRLYLSIWF